MTDIFVLFHSLCAFPIELDSDDDQTASCKSYHWLASRLVSLFSKFLLSPEENLN